MEESSKISAQSQNFKLYNIENINFNSRKRKPNSPRTIEAIKRCGCDLEDLYFVDFKRYKELHPELLSLAKDIQANRYDFHEKKRLERIEEIKAIRKKLVDGELTGSKIFKATGGTNLNNATKQSNLQTEEDKEGSTAIANEKKALERLKKKQQMEIFNIVQNEIRNEMIRKENEDKMRLQREKEERQLYAQFLKKKEEEFKRKEKETLKQEQAKKEEQERKKAELENYLEEQKKAKEEHRREKERMKQAKLKAEEDRQKQEEFKKQIARMFEEHQNKINERQRKLEEREQIRKELLEEKRVAQQMENQMKKHEKQKKIEKTLKNLDEVINQRKREYEEKQNLNDMKKQQFEQLRDLAFKKEKEKSMRKSIEIKKVIERNKELEQQKVQDYHEKQALIQRRKDEMKEYHDEEKRQKEEKIYERKKRIESALKVNEKQENMKKSRIIEKIQFNEEKLQNINMMKEREMMERSESQNLKRMERREQIKKIAHIQEYEREVLNSQLQEKNNRMQEMMYQKNIMALKRKEFSTEMAKKKDEYMKKFESIFRNKQFDENAIREIEGMFPDNKEFQGLINTLKNNSTFSGGASTQLRSQSSTLKKSKGGSSRMFFTNNLRKDKDSGSNLFSMNHANDYSLNMPMRQSHSRDEKLLNVSLPQKHLPNIDNSNTSAYKNIDYLSKNYYSKPNSAYGFNTNIKHEQVTKTRELAEKEVSKKVEQYRLTLNEDLLKILSEERQKEDTRERMLQEAESREERARLEKLFAIERSQASQKIVQFNKEIESKIENYERKIRSSFVKA